MADGSSRFAASQNKTTHERLSSNTVGLVQLSDYRKRRAEVLEQQEREAREAHLSPSATNTPPPDRSLTGTPNNASDASDVERQAKKKKLKKRGGTKLSFATEDGDEDGEEDGPALVKSKTKSKTNGDRDNGTEIQRQKSPSKFTANASVGIVPRSFTKSALRKEAAEREQLRKEFLALQSAVKATDFAIPFVFYDGTNIPGGTVRVRKGDFVWLFLDKSRKVGAERGVGGEKTANVRREWARVGIDDLMLVRGTMIIPHHYEFYFFIMNKTMGSGGVRLFDYSAEAPVADGAEKEDAEEDGQAAPTLLSNPKDRGSRNALPDISTLEGADEDPTFTKVVDRRWYERNKHIYPASMWQEFDPEKNYTDEIRRDTGGNAFFFAK